MRNCKLTVKNDREELSSRETNMITVNGDKIDFKNDMTIASVLEQLNFIAPSIIVRLNGKIIGSAAWEKVEVKDNDVIDAIHPMVGG